MTPTTIVVPCYNEASRLPVDAYLEFLSSQPELRVLFVDDGSQDDTTGVLQQLCKSSSGRCELLRLPENQGKAEAVRQGILQALDTGTSLVGFWDADLAVPLEATSSLAAVFEERPDTLMVFGSRVRMLGHQVNRDPFRHYAGRVFATVVSLLLDAAVYDTQCGAKLFRSCPTVEELFQEPFITKWIFDVEILARLKRVIGPQAWSRLGDLVYECPLQSWEDMSGTKVRPQDFLHAPLDLVAIYRHYLAG
jgi:glycosyltransferase involved in cell wall biosynthesis